MWTQMASRNVTAMAVTESNWEDLFAYLYSLHIFEFPAQVRRGREVLLEKRCTRCHAVPDAPKPVAALGKPVSAWRVDDPVEFVFGMWNHAAAMRDRIAAAREDWRTLSGRDLMDLTAYAQYVQKTVPMREFTMPDPAAGRSLFEANCGNCHRGSMSLAERLRNTTWMDIAAGMWNHVPRMPALPFVSSEDMRKILAYTWELQYMGEPGSPTRGENAFERKRCAACHSDAATKAHVSPRPGKTFTPFSIAALGWGPGRQMHQQMLERGVSWPRLSPTDVADLAAYLTALSKTAPERR
jgi:cytochrome c2